MSPALVSISCVPSGSLTALPRRKIRVLILDPHEFVRRGLRAVIDAEPDMTVCGAGDLAGPDLARIAALKPDVALVDVSLRDQRAIGVVRSLRRQFRALRIVALALCNDPKAVEAVLSAGASEFVLKGAMAERVLTAIRRAHAGVPAAPGAVAARTVGRTSVSRRSPSVRARSRSAQMFDAIETAIIALVGTGTPTHTIAVRLRLPLALVEATLARIRARLRLSGAVELVEFCVAFARRCRSRSRAT
jgi:DNA-binding NarL/FixJ family response regulator